MHPLTFSCSFSYYILFCLPGVESVEDIADLEEVGEIDEEDESAAPLEKSYANIIAYIEKQHMKVPHPNTVPMARGYGRGGCFASHIICDQIIS